MTTSGYYAWKKTGTLWYTPMGEALVMFWLFALQFLFNAVAATKKPVKTTKRAEAMDAKFGNWEKHTTGFGSKMLQKMGWTRGKGLGSSGEGIVNPVKAVKHTDFGKGMINIHSQVCSSSMYVYAISFPLLCSDGGELALFQDHAWERG